MVPIGQLIIPALREPVCDFHGIVSLFIWSNFPIKMQNSFSKQSVEHTLHIHSAGACGRVTALRAGLCLRRDLAFPSISMDTMRPAGPRGAARRQCPYYYLEDQWRPRLSPAGSARKKDTKAAASE